jgi:hypothetical protein
MEFKFTINTDNLNNPDDVEDAVEDFKLLIRFLQQANPNYYLLGNILDEQLKQQLEQDKQEDPPEKSPKELMQEKLDSMCPIRHDEIASAGFWQCFDNLRESIGEAMGPVSYEAFKLARYIEEQHGLTFIKEHNAGTKWVWDFVSYYENNYWEM